MAQRLTDLEVVNEYIEAIVFLGSAILMALTACSPGDEAIPPSITMTPQRTPTPASVTAGVNTDREALVAIYNSTEGPQWINDWNWTTDRPLGKWNGVSTDEHGRVIEIILGANGLTGTIPPELGNLANLEELILWDNDITGPIPPELGDLLNLKVLFLMNNEFNGLIPLELGNLANLEVLVLLNNDLTGLIPSELGNLVKLQSLELGGNKLTGELPQSLTMLTKLRSFGFYDNDGLCAPLNPIQDWLQEVDANGPTCPRR